MDARLKQLGLRSWSLLGIIALVVVIATAIGAISGIVIPLVIAIILGTVLTPLTAWLERHRVPRVPATLISMLVAVLVAIGVVVIVVRGFLAQLPEISRQLTVGWFSFVEWGRSLEMDTAVLEQIRRTFEDAIPTLSQGVLGAVYTTFSGVISFGIGTFFALFFLFFVLRDARIFPAWIAGLVRLNPAMVEDVVSLSQQSIRGYFRGTAITALITAPIFMVPLLLLDVPLALPIFILYFFTSFLPFIGAWITGFFSVLIAFGSGGATAALIVALSLLVSNGAIQSAVSSWALGSSLKIHPVAVLLATLVGGTVAGLLGMVLGAPLVAAVTRSMEAIERHRQAGPVPATAPVETQDPPPAAQR